MLTSHFIETYTSHSALHVFVRNRQNHCPHLITQVFQPKSGFKFQVNIRINNSNFTMENYRKLTKENYSFAHLYSKSG